jgi:hypothetical protein
VGRSNSAAAAAAVAAAVTSLCTKPDCWPVVKRVGPRFSYAKSGNPTLIRIRNEEEEAFVFGPRLFTEKPAQPPLRRNFEVWQMRTLHESEIDDLLRRLFFLSSSSTSLSFHLTESAELGDGGKKRQSICAAAAAACFVGSFRRLLRRLHAIKVRSRYADDCSFVLSGLPCLP